MTNKRTLNPNDPAIKEIMRTMNKQFAMILEKYASGESTKTGKVYESKNFRPVRKPNVINEMAITRAVNSKALANVRDAASRRDFNEDWATNAMPSPKFDDVELLNRYVAALLVYSKPCPQTMEDVEKIGIFKNYAKQMIEDGSITLEDVKKLYDNSPALAMRKRTGTKRAAAGFRKQQPTANYDFDHEDEAPAAEPAPEPEIEELPEIPAYDDADDDDDYVPEPEFVNNDEPENDPEEELEQEEEYPDDNFGIDDSEEISDPIPADVRDIDNIDELTVEDYYDPAMNASFAAHNPDHFVYQDGKIGFEIKIYDENDEMLGEYTMLRDSLGQALADFAVITMSTLSAMSDNYFDFRITKVIDVFYKSFYRKLSDEQSDELDNRIQKFYYSTIQGAKNLDDILKALDEMGEAEE